MTISCDEAFVTPSERLLQVGERRGLEEASNPAPWSYQAALLAAYEADPFITADLCVEAGLPTLDGWMPSPNASTQFASADDPRRVLFERLLVVSASSMAGVMLLAHPTASMAVAGYRVMHSLVAQQQQSFSLWYGAPAEEISVEPIASASVLECITVDDEAFEEMDRVSQEHLSRRAQARAEERRLQRFDRG